MIDLLFTFGATAECRTQLPSRSFDDSQDCLTFLKRRLEGFGRLRIGPRGQDIGRRPAPWRSL